MDIEVDVLLFGSSLRQPAHTRALLDRIREALLEAGTRRAEIWDLAERPLPPAQPAYHANPERYLEREADAFVSAVASSHALVIGTPCYHYSFSGVVKNALDLLTIPAVERKPVALVSNAGGRRTSQPVDHLSQVVRGLRGLVLPVTVITTDSDYSRPGHRFEVNSPDVEKRIHRMARELVDLTRRLGHVPSSTAPAVAAKPEIVPPGRRSV